MFVDASALVAILVKESDYPALVARLESHGAKITSPLAVWETAVAVARKRKIDPGDALVAVERLLGILGVEVRAVAPETAELAVAVFSRFGKGRHPAALNFGDCFAYACARQHGMPLLYKGDDFAKTDIEPA